MAETLGSLCDKLATVKLKLWHTDDAERLQSLRGQEQQLHQEAFAQNGENAGILKEQRACPT